MEVRLILGKLSRRIDQRIDMTKDEQWHIIDREKARAVKQEKILVLPLNKRLKMDGRAGERQPDVMRYDATSIDDPGMDEFMTAVSLFRNVNHLNFITPSHCYFIMKRLGYKK